MVMFLNAKLASRQLMSDIITVNNLVEIYSDGTKAVDDTPLASRKGNFSVF
jgi:hypothetical protein